VDIAMIGLGRMGAGLSRRLLRAGHRVVGFDVSEAARDALVADGGAGAVGLEDAVAALTPPRTVWVMLPAGEITETAIAGLTRLLGEGDILIEGGNTHFRDSQRRASAAGATGIRYLDIGVSGGIWGLEEGFCLMAGGDAAAFAIVEPLLAALAPPTGYAHVGPSGAGHYTKMVHNGIEYALMQAYAEGFELLHDGPFQLDPHQLAALWNQGSVVRSWLLELAERALAADGELSGLAAYVEDSGEGRWTVAQAISSGIPVPTIAAALFARFSSRQDSSYALRLLAALRREFGGHAVRPG